MRLIDAEALKEKFQECINSITVSDPFITGVKNGYESAEYWINEAPTVEERKHGHWEGGVLTTVLIATHMPQQMYLAAGWILLNSIIVIIAGLLWTVNPNEHTKVRKINSFIKTNHLENAYE